MSCFFFQGSEKANKMLPQRMKKVMTDNPKKLANLIDLVNLPSTLREFMGQSQTSRLGCFKRVWSYIKENNLQVPVVASLLLWFLVAELYISIYTPFQRQPVPCLGYCLMCDLNPFY